MQQILVCKVGFHNLRNDFLALGDSAAFIRQGSHSMSWLCYWLVVGGLTGSEVMALARITVIDSAKSLHSLPLLFLSLFLYHCYRQRLEFLSPHPRNYSFTCIGQGVHTPFFPVN